VSRVLWTGVDTLEASFAGDLADDLRVYLGEKKGQSQQDKLPVAATIGGKRFFVHPAGMRPWHYRAENEEMQLRLHSESQAPALSVRLSALGLVTQGHVALYGLAREIAKSLDLSEAGVTRLDIAVDFQGWAPTEEEMKNVVCPAKYRSIHWNGREPETFYFGKGDLLVRVYNKTREIVKHGKEWMRDVWAQSAGFDPQEEVWRFEVQMRRPVLKAMGCADAGSALEQLDRLLGFAFGWCNLRVPSGPNQTRWPEDPRWTALRKGARAGELLQRAKVAYYLGTFSRSAHRVLAHVVTGGAALNVYDFEYVWDLLCKAQKDYIAETGKDFATLVKERQRRQAGRI
jgi:hypothetical protein